MSSSHVYLPARHVLAACNQGIAWFTGRRDEFKSERIDLKRKTQWFKRTDAIIWLAMPPEEQELVNQRFAYEEAQCRNLKSLAIAAMYDALDMRIDVSMRDYLLIETFYGNDPAKEVRR